MNYHGTQLTFIAYLICGLRVPSHDQEGAVRSCKERTFIKVHFTTVSVEIYCLTVAILCTKDRDNGGC